MTTVAGGSHDRGALDGDLDRGVALDGGARGNGLEKKVETERDTVKRGPAPGGLARAGSPGDTPAPAARVAALRALPGRHRTFTVILTIGLLLRSITMLGYRPAMFFNDSFDYLHAAMKMYPHPLRPNGYSFFLAFLKPFHSFGVVVAIQHLMGLAMGVMIYALLRKRFALPGWGAALATVPVLLDAYQIQLEHLVLSDAPFTFLIVSAITLLLWHVRPSRKLSWKIGTLIGLIVGLASLTRSIGLPVLAVAAGFLLVRRAGWRPIVAMVVAFAIPMGLYSAWFYSHYDKFATTESSGIFLYARVYKFVDCSKINPPIEESALCVADQNRQKYSQDGIWHRKSPLHRVPSVQRFGPYQNQLAGDFAKRAILAQPTDYAKVVAGDFLRTFRWNRTVFPDRATYEQYEFGERSTALPEWRMSADATAAQEATAYEQGRARTRLVEPFAGIVRGYQDVFYLRGTMLGIILLMGLAGIVPLWRRFGGAAALPLATAVGLLLAPAATAEFDYRYVLPTAPLACLAAAIACAPESRRKLATAAPARIKRLRGRGRGSAPDPASDPESQEPQPALR